MRRACIFATLAVALAALPARASVDDLFIENKPQDYHSPQHFAVEIKFGPYSPDIDSTPGLMGTPFSDEFNSQFGSNVGKRPPGKLLSTIEFDWQFLHRFGSLGLGLSLGFSQRYTHAFQYDMTTGSSLPCQVPNCVRSNDTTTLTVMPITLELVYRFDVLALRYHIPVVPYLKAGLGYYFWFIQSGDGSLARAMPTDAEPDAHDKAIGGTLGLVTHPGVALMLDDLDATAARTLDSELGINHTYVFFEMNYGWITGLGAKDKMVFSDLTWSAGAAFEF
jgi:hypothetical protein